MAEFSFFLMASNSPQCIHILNFFIYLSVDGHFGGRHILTIMDNAAIKRAVTYVFNILFSFPLSIYPDVELLDHMPRR